jgi:hypothetical protein
MPYTEKEQKLRRALVKKYGLKKAVKIFSAMEVEAAQGRKHTNNFGAVSKARTKKRLHIR